MYQGIIISEDTTILKECREIIDAVGDIRINTYNALGSFHLNANAQNLLFIILTQIDQENFTLLASMEKTMPDVTTILYNHSLNLSNLNQLNYLSSVYFVVGENRQKTLKETVKNLKKNYWRTIPFDQFGIRFERLSPRIQKALKFVETADIGKCNITGIADYLNISPGYFSQEFKRETGQPFRSFMQKVLAYYEDLILKKANIPAHQISQMLGYSELSSFSRSFKKRKGISLTKYKKMVKM